MTTPTPRHEEYNADSLAAYALAIQEGKDTLAPDEQAHMCAAFSACLRDLAAAQAELERVGYLCNKHYLDAVDAKERAERSEAEAKKNAKDAERYRWLRGNKPDYRGLVAVINLRDNTDAWLSGEYLDKAIDAAIAGEKK